MDGRMPQLLGIGEKFPDFSMEACVSAEPGKEFRIVDATNLDGKWSVVFFWPLDFTFICPTEIVEFDHALPAIRALDGRLFGVSGDSHHVHLAWRRENPSLHRIGFPMLADYRKELAERLGILHPLEKVPLRATYITDPDRIIRWLCINDLSVGRNTQEVLRVLEALRSGELMPCNWTPGQAPLPRPDQAGGGVHWETTEYAIQR